MFHSCLQLVYTYVCTYMAASLHLQREHAQVLQCAACQSVVRTQMDHLRKEYMHYLVRCDKLYD